MPLYNVKKYFRLGAGAHHAGDVVELTEDQAWHVNQDEPGTVELCPVVEDRAMDAPPSDRMVRQSKKRGGK